jgi:hypothetical protein
MRLGSVAVAALAAVVLGSCGGGGNGDGVTITGINLNPAAVTAGSIVALTASISAPGQSVSSLVKNWTVNAGSLTVAAPDFSLLLRETARGTSATSVSTTGTTVYWLAPAAGGPATITVSVESESESLDVTVSTSPVTLSVTSGSGGAKICTVATNDVTDLYQAAFRINFTSAWQPASAEAGDFLGGANDILTLAMLDQNGFVPMAVTRKGSVAGVDGSGTLATIEFTPAQTTSATREVMDVPFELSMVILRNSTDEPIDL